MDNTAEITKLAQDHARTWLGKNGIVAYDNEEIKWAIYENLENPTYKNAIESEILRLDTSPHILRDFHSEIEFFVNEAKFIAEQNGKPVEELKLTRIKPNSNNLVINL